MNKNRQGFALIIVAVLLVIFGAVIISRFQVEPVIERKARITTQAKLKEIRKALIIYYKKNTNAPCPALVGANKGTSTFGTAAPGAACAGTISSTGSIYKGAVPTRTLGLPDDYAYDEWGNRLSYYADVSGANLQVYTLDTTTAYTPLTNIDGDPVLDGKVNAVVISHGLDQVGSYKNTGLVNSVSPCSGTASQNQNCDTTNGTFYFSNKSTGFDDLTTYIAAGGCTPDKCAMGFRVGQWDSDGTGSRTIHQAWQVFRISAAGALTKVFDSAASSPWKIANGAGGANGMYGVSCTKTSDTSNTICSVVGAGGKFGTYVLSVTSTNFVASSHTATGPTPADTEIKPLVDCEPISATKALCLATDGVDLSESSSGYNTAAPYAYWVYTIDTSGAMEFLYSGDNVFDGTGTLRPSTLDCEVYDKTLGNEKMICTTGGGGAGGWGYAVVKIGTNNILATAGSRFVGDAGSAVAAQPSGTSCDTINAATPEIMCAMSFMNGRVMVLRILPNNMTVSDLTPNASEAYMPGTPAASNAAAGIGLYRLSTRSNTPEMLATYNGTTRLAAISSAANGEIKCTRHSANWLFCFLGSSASSSYIGTYLFHNTIPVYEGTLSLGDSAATAIRNVSCANLPVSAGSFIPCITSDNNPYVYNEISLSPPPALSTTTLSAGAIVGANTIQVASTTGMINTSGYTYVGIVMNNNQGIWWVPISSIAGNTLTFSYTSLPVAASSGNTVYYYAQFPVISNGATTNGAWSSTETIFPFYQMSIGNY